MVELAYRSGKVKKIEANVVRTGDAFDYRHGTRAFLDYTPAEESGRGNRRYVYALAELTTGGKPFVVLNPGDVEQRMKASPSHKSPFSIWQTHPDAAWVKSAVRAL